MIKIIISICFTGSLLIGQQNQSAMANQHLAIEDAVVESSTFDMQIAILPLYRDMQSQNSGPSVDSLLLAEVRNSDLALVEPEYDASMWIWDGDQLCLSETCMKQYESELDLTHILVWSFHQEDRFLNLSLFNLATFDIENQLELQLPENQENTKESIHNAVVSLFNEIPVPVLLDQNETNKWLRWFDNRNNRLIAISVGTVTILTWIALQGDSDEVPPDDIGLPPEWPTHSSQ